MNKLIKATFERLSIKPFQSKLSSIRKYNLLTKDPTNGFSLTHNPLKTFTKVSKKKQEKLDHLKEKSETELSDTIDLTSVEENMKQIINNFKVMFSISFLFLKFLTINILFIEKSRIIGFMISMNLISTQ